MAGRMTQSACVLMLLAFTFVTGAAESNYSIKLHRPDKVGDELEIAAARAMRITTRYEVGEREPQVTQRMIAADIRGRVTVLEVDERGSAQKASWVVEHATLITSPREEERPLLPKGTILKITGWHDNTAANKANPDPNVWVGYGDRTVDEMAHAWVNVTYMSDEDYRAEVKARRDAMATATSAPDRQQR